MSRVIDWTYSAEVVERCRALAQTRISNDPTTDAASLLAVLRCLAAHADHDSGEEARPGLRTIADETVLGRQKVARALRTLVAVELIVNTGECRGKGGTVVYTLPCTDTTRGGASTQGTGTSQDGASSEEVSQIAPREAIDAEPSGTTRGGASSNPNWPRTGTT